MNATTASHTYNSAGSYAVTGTVYDNFGRSARTTKSLTVAAGPTVVGVTPNSGSGTSQSFSFVYADSSGYQTLNTLYAYAGSGADANSCFLRYQPASNSLSLLNDAATVWQGPVQLGTTAMLQNSQCTVSAASSSASGAGTNLTLNLALSFSSGYAGTQKLWMDAVDNGGSKSGWQVLGSWTVTVTTVTSIQHVLF